MVQRLIPKILMIEDDLDTAELIRETLIDHFEQDNITHAPTLAEARKANLTHFDLVLSDLNLPDGSGLDIIEEFLNTRHDLPIVMVTSESTLDIARTAIHKGAYDYIVKAGDYLFTIPLIVEKNLAVWQTKRENARLQNELKLTLEELQDKNQQLESAVTQLEEQAATDPLTGLANRRHVQEVLDRSFAETQRYNTDMACMMIDLDSFKQLNDTLGHQMGDKVLEMTAKVLTANCRRSDMAGRYGGDEFVLLLPHTEPELARQVALRIQEQFNQASDQLLNEKRNGLSMSVGISCASMSQPANADQLVALADAALYRAKQSGKSRVVVHQKPDNYMTISAPDTPSNPAPNTPAE